MVWTGEKTTVLEFRPLTLPSPPRGEGTYDSCFLAGPLCFRGVSIKLIETNFGMSHLNESVFLENKMLRCRLLLWCALAGIGMGGAVSAGEYNPVLNIGDAAPAWEDLPGVDGKTHSLADLKKKPVVVVVFTCNSCPYAVDYEDRINAFAKKYAGETGRVAVAAINVNHVPADSLAKMQVRRRKKALCFRTCTMIRRKSPRRMEPRGRRSFSF